MCLFKKHFFIKKTASEKTVYKVLLYDSINNRFITPYEKIDVNIHECQYPIICNKFKYFLNLFFSDLIEDGFIHSFTNIEYAKYEANMIRQNYANSLYSVILYECKIPKNTYHFIGKCGDIASKKLIYVRQVK